MKSLITFILLFIVFGANAQTKLDSVLTNKINAYRVSKGLSPYILSVDCFKSAELQTKFVFENVKNGSKSISHKGDSLTPTPKDRYIKVSGESPKSINENITYIGNFNYKKGDDRVLDELSNRILNNWIKSPNHNANLLSDNKYCGVSVLYTTSPSGFVNYEHYTTIGTFVSVR